jgi:DNA-binding MarR family transcriptional regulator
MSTEVGTEPAGYWYEDARVDATDVLNALRRYRSAESAARRRARDSLGIGENAMAALRILIAAGKAGHAVNAKELAERLDVTAASTSALVDRLVRSGHVLRLPDPVDRRGVLLSATGASMDRAREVIAALDEHMIDAADRLSPDDAAVVVAFLDDVADVTEGVGRVREADSAGR